MTAPHIDDHGQHIKELERRLLDLQAQFSVLGSSSEIDEMLVIMHWPGWTTLTHLNLVNALVDAAERSASDLQAIRSALVDGARLIGEEARDLGGVGAI